MRLLIIVTDAVQYGLWKMTEAWTVESRFADTVVRSTTIANDRILILGQAESSAGDVSQRIEDIRGKTTPWVIEIANSPLYPGDTKVYVATHSNYVNLKKVLGGVIKERMGACASFNHLPESPGLDVVSDALYPLLTKPDHQRFDTAVASITQKRVWTPAQRLTALKHDLANVFLPIAVDLDGWRECDYDDGYMEDILKSQPLDDEPLERARKLLYIPGHPVTGESVEKIVKEFGLVDDPLWRTVKLLLPRRPPHSQEEKTDASSFVRLFEDQDLLGSMKDKQKLKSLKTVLAEGDPFREWYSQLDKGIMELHSKMDQSKADE